jgi:hypothetical protein
MMEKKHQKHHQRCGTYMEKRVSKMKSNAVYNHWDNLVYVRTDGNMIHVICHKEEQMDAVNERFHGTGNEFVGYEEWDEGDDKKWIMTWKVPQEYDKLIEYN